MKAFIKGFLILGLGLAVLLLVNLCFFRPFSITAFYAKSFVEFAVVRPQMLSSLHILEQYGIKFHQSELDDLSEAGSDRAAETLGRIATQLRAYDTSSFDVNDRNNYESFAMFIDAALENSLRWRYHNYPVNQLSGIQSEFPSFMDSSHQISTKRDASDYVTRLSKVKTQFLQVLEGLEIRQRKGIIPPRFVIDRVLDEMMAFVATAPEQNILYQSLDKKLLDAGMDATDRSQILIDAKQEIVRTVYPAYQIFIEHFQSLKTVANDDDGVWKFPDGAAFYAAALKEQTTTSLNPDDIHEIGLGEVKRLEGEMKAIIDQQGLVGASVGEAMIHLGNDPKFLFPDSDEGRAQIIAGYNAIIAEADERMKEFFDQRPKAKLEVKRIPLFKEKTAPGGYFEQAALDGSKPGTFYANLYDIKATPKFGMRTLAYHEGIPGHHFQISLAQENKKLAFFRKIIMFTAYVEGWALYAEQLAWEAGLGRDPYDTLGRLQSEIFRSVRLVVDTGIHHKRWTRSQAIRYMIDHTGMTESDVISEIERYIVNPGQACSYKVGMLKILELRARAQKALGPKFSLKDFHRVVLEGGALPLSLLESNVDRWIGASKMSAG